MGMLETHKRLQKEASICQRSAIKRYKEQNSHELTGKKSRRRWYSTRGSEKTQHGCSHLKLLQNIIFWSRERNQANGPTFQQQSGDLKVEITKESAYRPSSIVAEKSKQIVS